MATGSISWLEFGTAPTVTGSISWLEFGLPGVLSLTGQPGAWAWTMSSATLTLGGPAPQTGSISFIEFGPLVSYSMTGLPGSWEWSFGASQAGQDMVGGPGAWEFQGGSATLTGPPAPIDTSAAAIWSYVMSNGRTAEENVLDILTKVSELHRIHGLELGAPLSVTESSRAAGAIAQSISNASGVVTVTRQ